MYANDILTEDFFQKLYVDEQKSFAEMSSHLQKKGISVSRTTLWRKAKKFITSRSLSEAKRAKMGSPDYRPLITETTNEHIDGFLLGDGHIQANVNKIKTGRASCGVLHKEFCEYLMSGFATYKPTIRPAMQSSSFYEGKRQYWRGRTRLHPDLWSQKNRWYKKLSGKWIKTVPEDVRITPLSVMVWYLGDGSISERRQIELSTYAFTQRDTDILLHLLEGCGVSAVKNSRNCLKINPKNIDGFFDFIGECPVECYRYKFPRI